MASRKSHDLKLTTHHQSCTCRCIEKWLRSAGGGKCPQCNCKAKRSDVRVIFAKTVSMQDTSERDRALKELEEEKLLRIQDKREASQLLLELNLVRCERDKLKEEVERLKVQLASFPSCSAVSAPLLTGPGLVGEGSAPAGGVGVGRYTPLKTICVSRVGVVRGVWSAVWRRGGGVVFVFSILSGCLEWQCSAPSGI